MRLCTCKKEQHNIVRDTEQGNVNFFHAVIYKPIQIVHTCFVRNIRVDEILMRESS